MSMKKRIVFILLSFAIMPSLVIGIFSYHFVSDRLLEIAGNEAYSLAVSNKETLQNILESQKDSISSLTSSPLVKEVLEAARNHTISRNDGEYQRMYPLLVKKANKSSICQKISIYDTDNKVVVSSDESCLGITQSQLSGLHLTKDNFFVTASLSHPDSSAYYQIDIVCPYYKDSVLLGYIISTIDTSYFDNMLEAAHLDDNRTILLADSEGHVLYHTTSQFIGKSIDSDTFSFLNSSMETADNGYFPMNYGDNGYILGYGTIADLGWLILTSQKLEPLLSLSDSILIASAACIIVMIILSIIISAFFYRILTSPINKLKAAMKEVSNGNFDVQCETTVSEFTDLYKSFNKMTQILKTTHEDFHSM